MRPWRAGAADPSKCPKDHEENTGGGGGYNWGLSGPRARDTAILSLRYPILRDTF